MKISNEFKTGLVIVAAILATAIFYLKTTDFSAHPYKVKTYFNLADGVKEDAVVKLCGIEVGRVEKISFTYSPETKVELVLTLKDVAKIHQDATAFIATTGLIGDAYIGLTPGSPDKPFLKDGDVVAGEDPVEMRRLWKKAESITDNLDKTLMQVRGLAENANGILTENRQRIDAIIANVEATSASFKEFSSGLKPRADIILANVQEMSVNFKDFSQDLKQHPWKLLMKGSD